MKNFIYFIILIMLSIFNSEIIYSKHNIFKKNIVINHVQNIKNIEKHDVISNINDFIKQINLIKQNSHKIYIHNKKLYLNILKWIKKSKKIDNLKLFNIVFSKIKGNCNTENVKITSYYTPTIKAKHKKEGNFVFPIYRMPITKKYDVLPTRKQIYKGALEKKYILAYTDSLFNNFIMEVQGSGYINFIDEKKTVFFGYQGENGWPYTSIGKIIAKSENISYRNISMKNIYNWIKHHSPEKVQRLLEKNQSFVFFKPNMNKIVKGSSMVPLIPQTAIAVDPLLIKPGSVLLLKMPLINIKGEIKNKYVVKLLIALDVGGAIKGQHIDIYQGATETAKIIAGYYNHYGKIWILSNK